MIYEMTKALWDEHFEDREDYGFTIRATKRPYFTNDPLAEFNLDPYTYKYYWFMKQFDGIEVKSSTHIILYKKKKATVYRTGYKWAEIGEVNFV